MSQYILFNRFVIRTPTLPIQNQSINKEEDLNKFLQDQKFQEALFLASPNLYNKLSAYLNNELKREKDKKTLPYSLLQYASRMTSRCTPFGLFAGVSLGHFDEKTHLVRSGYETFRKSTRLDMNYLCALVNDLSQNIYVKKHLKFFPNTSLYSLGGQLRYVEYTYHNANRRHRISAVDDSSFLQVVLSHAEHGAYLDFLADLLVDDEITKEEADAFIEELVENQILVSELEPVVTGADFFKRLKVKVDELEGVESISDTLDRIDEQLVKINNSPIGHPEKQYKDLTGTLKKLDTKFETKFLFQSDLYIPFNQCTVEKFIRRDLYKGLEILNQVTPINSGNPLFEGFKKSFYERFEEEEVPLSFVFDSELGMGYRQDQSSTAGDITPLVDDLKLPLNNENPRFQQTPFTNYLLSKYTGAIKKDEYNIQIRSKELDGLGLKAKWDDLPDSFSTMVNIINENDKYKLLMKSAGGHSAANLLGRFGNMNERIFKHIKNITDTEKLINSDKILAEIVHLPQSRTGNILFRPVYREYEIPYLARSSVDKAYQLPLDDLTLSYRNGKIILRSKKLDKEIVPKLSNAHNFSINSLPIYHFLCDLQSQNKRIGVGFNWGFLDKKHGFLPRVEFENIILSRATWNLVKKDTKHLYQLEGYQLIQEMNEFREKWNIPEKVALVEGDNELYIDLMSPLFINMFLDTVKKRSNFQVVEFLHLSENAIVNDSEGNSYVSQFVFAFYKKEEEKINDYDEEKIYSRR